jgi:hypothetical protein
MDNRINEIRRKISSLRAEMLGLGDTIRDQINRDQDCSEASIRLMALRREMVDLVQQRRASGDNDRCPIVEQRLTEDRRLQSKRIKPSRGVIVRR